MTSFLCLQIMPSSAGSGFSPECPSQSVTKKMKIAFAPSPTRIQQQWKSSYSMSVLNFLFLSTRHRRTRYSLFRRYRRWLSFRNWLANQSHPHFKQHAAMLGDIKLSLNRSVYISIVSFQRFLLLVRHVIPRRLPRFRFVADIFNRHLQYLSTLKIITSPSSTILTRTKIPICCLGQSTTTRKDSE